MLKSISIRNFRGFSSLDLSSLSRINIFTGMNGCGKTSLLEVPFLLAGGTNAGMAISLYNFRNETNVIPSNDMVFRGLFNNLDTSNKIVLESKGDFQGRVAVRRRVEITPIKDNIIPTISTDEVEYISGIKMSFIGQSYKNKPLEGSISWEIKSTEIQSDGTTNQHIGLKQQLPENKDIINGFFISPYYRELWQQVHGLLTKLTKANKVHDVVKHMSMIQPNLKNLIPLSERGMQVIYADIGKDKLLPISLLGSGFSNILHIVLDSTVLTNGFMIIDEIEDGLHYSILPDLVSFLFKISIQNNLQFFISTHSEEVLGYFASIAKRDDYQDISLRRIITKKDKCTVTDFDLNEIISSINIDAELR